MADSKLLEYSGNCHCGAFKFSFKSPEIKQASVCDCSICSKNGYLWAKSQDFKVLKGDFDTTLTGYEFGPKSLSHKFCPNCGTSVLARLNPEKGDVVLVNIRSVQGIDFPSLTIGEPRHGSAAGEPYKPPTPVAAEVVPAGSSVYHGNCRCGAVAFALVSPDKISEASECNCSICWRDAGLWIYPPTKNITFRGLDSASEYTFAAKLTYHGFCKVCGVSLFERFVGNDPPLHDKPEYYGKDRNLWTALNVRTINDLDVSTLQIEKVDRSGQLPLYVVPE
ncbi:GFA domain-containing protein [Mycena indigotica]|uniref:GFA domain-containing protein n=1 Tax=Mycena indigotica TaxID=2126181 RepID=A0A8H6SPB2_9AGAR|nr:GFA domain-containing protein [Mycena indigotica]KAF7302276.1 GFA domain-containing protein [Mycena indigotica]